MRRSHLIRLPGGKRTSHSLNEEGVRKEQMERSWGRSCPSKSDKYRGRRRSKSGEGL